MITYNEAHQGLGWETINGRSEAWGLNAHKNSSHDRQSLRLQPFDHVFFLPTPMSPSSKRKTTMTAGNPEYWIHPVLRLNSTLLPNPYIHFTAARRIEIHYAVIRSNDRQYPLPLVATSRKEDVENLSPWGNSNFELTTQAEITGSKPSFSSLVTFDPAIWSISTPLPNSHFSFKTLNSEPGH